MGLLQLVLHFTGEGTQQLSLRNLSFRNTKFNIKSVSTRFDDPDHGWSDAQLHLSMFDNANIHSYVYDVAGELHPSLSGAVLSLPITPGEPQDSELYDCAFIANGFTHDISATLTSSQILPNGATLQVTLVLEYDDATRGTPH